MLVRLALLDYDDGEHIRIDRYNADSFNKKSNMDFHSRYSRLEKGIGNLDTCWSCGL